MTRVFEAPGFRLDSRPWTRVLIVGAGLYPHAQIVAADRPRFRHLSSVRTAVRALLQKLLGEWQVELAAPLGTVDLLLSEEQASDGTLWQPFGLPGEAAAGTPIEPPNNGTMGPALTSALAEAKPDDVLLVFFCGHGFWKGSRYFVLSDFGAREDTAWSVVDLDSLAQGLATKPPRTQWLFFDCCADISDEALEVIDDLGGTFIQITATAIRRGRKFGTLSQFGLASAAPGLQAFGISGGSTRFAEMLIEAIDGSGAQKRHDNAWWVDHVGLDDAIRSYHRRVADLDRPEFYKFVAPLKTEAPVRMRLRRLPAEPTSCLIATTAPPHLMRGATLVLAQRGGAAPINHVAPQNRLHLPLPPRRHFDVTLTFADSSQQVIEVFSDLPVAEPDPAEFVHGAPSP